MELVFAYSYFAQQKDQHRNFNWIVVGMLIADSVGTGALLANTYIVRVPPFVLNSSNNNPILSIAERHFYDR